MIENIFFSQGVPGGTLFYFIPLCYQHNVPPERFIPKETPISFLYIILITNQSRLDMDDL
jgi:hypothetical protein